MSKKQFEQFVSSIENDYSIIQIRNIRFRGNYVFFKADRDSLDSTNKYRRLSAQGKNMSNCLCFHGFERIIIELFKVGAVNISSAWGAWKTIDGFYSDYNNLQSRLVGYKINSDRSLEHKYATDLCVTNNCGA